MAITKSQQARQMLKKGTSKPVVQGGVDNYLGKQPQVVAPRKWQSSPDAPPTELAYITKAEKDLILKKDIHGSLKKGPNMGPSGIISLDSFGDADGSGMAGGDVSRAERGDFGPIGGGNLPPGVKSKPTKTEQELRSAFIAAGGGQRVNPGFFDSRNRVSRDELALAKSFAPGAFAKTRGGGIMNFITGGGFLGNIIRGLGQRLGFGKRFNEPTYDMSRFSGLPLGGSASFQNLDIRDKYNRLDTDEDDTLNIDEFGYSPNFLSGLVDEVALTGTPEQKELMKEKMETSEEQADDDMFEGAMVKLNKLETREYNTLQTGKDLGLNTPEQNKRLEELEQKKNQESALTDRAFVADGGYMGGGIMDAAGRQQYFLGKLVKKAKRAVKKIVKSPVGKIGLGAALAFTPFGKAAIGKFAGLSDPMKYLIGGAGLSALPFIFGNQEDDTQQLASMGSVGGQIPDAAYTDPRSVMFRAFRMAEGGRIGLKDGEGIMKVASNDANERLLEQLFEQFLEEGFSPAEAAKKAREAFYDRDFAGAKGGDVEPVAKKTMPLLDMGGQEMDLRAEGGFVPIGRMEKADDVPARLSKNEFVFTADAVRNAGDGDVDKGAEVMYNMMKNLEAGGDVSEESQGLEGARRMFQTSKRLEEVI